MNKIAVVFKQNNKIVRCLLALLGLVFFGVLASALLPAAVEAWPTNRLDSVKGQPYCTSCHNRTTGSLTILDVKVNGVSQGVVNSVSVNTGGTIEITYRTQGLGYLRFTAAGAIQTSDVSKWGIGPADTPWSDNGRTDTTPWTIAQQTTLNGSPLNSPFMFATDFPSSDTAERQRGVTYDNANTGTPGDRNRLAHNEVFNVKLTAPATTGTYTIYLQGVGNNSAGNLAYNQQAFTVTVTSDTTPPSVPTGVSAGSPTGSSLTVSWTGSTDTGGGTVAGYKVFRSTNGVSYQQVADVASPPYTDVDLLQSTTYWYQVKAYDTSGNISDFSAPGSGSTTGDPRTDTKAPSTPANFTAIAGNGQVQLSWTASPEGDVVTYRIQRSTTAGNFTTPTEFTVSAPNTNYLDLTTANGTTYYYRILAEDVAAKTSAYSAEISATPTVDQGAVQPHGLYNVNGRKEMCQYCHSTHTSTGKKLLLKQTSEATCYLCHDGTGSKYNTLAEFDIQKNPTHHKVPEGQTFCNDCHNPHFQQTPATSGTTGKTTGSKRLLWATRNGNGPNSQGNQFCWTCHGAGSDLPRPFGLDHQTYFTNSSHNIGQDSNANGIMMLAPDSGTNIACVNCHEKHGSRDYPLLKSTNSSNFCINCHQDKGFTNEYNGLTKNGITIANSSNYFIGSPHEVNFYGRNGCTMCHEPHGTNQPFMLTAPFPTAAYPAQVTHATNELCFTCHDYRYYIGSGGGNPITGSRFGNGNGTNYHWHVTKYKLTCRTCHDPHGGSNQSFNGYQAGWDLNNPVNVSFDWSYVKGSVSPSNGRLAFVSAGTDASGEATGYSCYLTCKANHRPKGYIRNVRNAPQLNCAACHNYEEFAVNSAHPIVYNGTASNKKVECQSCHEPDHTKHTTANPYGLKNPVDWTDPVTSTVVAPNPVSIPNFNTYGYRGFCFTCHGNTRAITDNYEANFEGKPHSLLSRTTNLYGTAADGKSKDMPCLVCHEHHASTNVRLLKKDIDTTDQHAVDADTDRGKINACLDCHDGYPSVQNINSLYNAPTSAGHFIKSVDATKKLLCTECHSPHGTSNDFYLWDRDKYSTFTDARNGGTVSWPTGKTGAAFNVRTFCLTCHKTSDATGSVYYDTTKTIKVTTPGQPANILEIKPMPGTINSHSSASSDKCSLCHDPHKPWPATGSNADCYMCHGNSGQATNIEVLMGLNGTPSVGKVSKHKITDPTTADTNDCMSKCHSQHPHDPRANNLKVQAEKDLCTTCHVQGAAGTQPKIDTVKYAGKPHDYNKQLHAYSDGSNFTGNCTKCHTPHGSDYSPLLRWQNGDSLCTQCHNGTTTDGNGNPISNIKTMWDSYGHYYKSNPAYKLRCAECHIPHGSTNTKYLKDTGNNTIYTNGITGQVRSFPTDLTPENNKRAFCNTCHLYSDSTDSFVRYTSTSAPGVTGYVDIAKLPTTGPQTGISLPAHASTSSEACSNCHNPHDPRPTGSNADCYKCHGGSNSYATNIDSLAGWWGYTGFPGQNTWPDGAGGRTTVSSNVYYHKISDPLTANSNTCMTSCHKPHGHNPKANLIKDFRQASADVTPPNPPVMQGAAAASNSQIRVSWTPSDSTDIFGYYIYRDDFTLNAPVGVLNSNANSGTLTFVDGGITPGTHNYEVVAFDKVGNKSAITTPAVSATASYLADTESPSVPQNLSLSVLGTNRISLAWSPSTDNSKVKGYNIERSTDGTNFTKIGFTGGTSFVDGAGDQDTLTQNTLYYYRVKAIDITADYGGSGNPSLPGSTVSGTTSKPGGGNTSGSYQKGSDILEIFNSSNAHTNQITAGTNVRVKVTTPNIPNATTASISVLNYLGTTVNTYPMTKVSNTSPYAYEVTFPAPATAGLYTVYFNLQDSGGYRIRSYEALEVQATSRHFRTFSDPGYTVEATDFQAGQTVYVEVFADNGNGTINTGLSTNRIQGYNVDTLATISYVNAPARSTSYIRYAFNMPALTPGNWYVLYNRFRDNNSTTLTNTYKQIKVVAPDTTAPAAPVLNIPVPADITDTTVRLNWSLSPDTDVAGYTIYRQEGVTWVKAGAVDQNTNTFVDTGLKPDNTGYNYKVVVSDAAGNINSSGTVGISTKPEVADTTAPATPTGVNATAKSASTVEISWAANSVADGVAGYNIYRVNTDAGIATTLLKIGSTTGTSFTDSGLKGATGYSYKVTAYDMSGNESAASGVVMAETQSTPADSLERALCMSCHDGTSATRSDGSAVPPGAPVIGTAYNQSKHNVDTAIKLFTDGSTYYGNCTKCHVPHGSQYAHLLKGPETNELCFACHYGATANQKYSGRRTFELSKHAITSASGSGTPIVYRDAGSSNPRDPANPADVAEFAGKCFNCHTPHSRYVSGAKGGDGTTAIKGALRDGTKFTAGGNPYVTSNDMCEDCHGSTSFGAWNGFVTYNQTAHGNNQNTLVMWDAGSAPAECVNCHDPHGTEYSFMLKLPMNTNATDANGTLKNKVCLNCHDKAEILAVTYWFKGGAAYQASKHFTSAQWYDAVNDTTAEYVPGNCMNCHSPHGKPIDPNNPGAGIYPKQLLMSPDSNALCYNCHDSRVLAEKAYVNPADPSNSDYYYVAAAPAYPTKYDSTVHAVNTLNDAVVTTQGKTVYETSGHFTNNNAKWPGGAGNAPYTQASTQKGACYNCHDPHGSGYSASALKSEEELCKACHTGTGPSTKKVDVNANYGSINDSYAHKVSSYTGKHTSEEDRTVAGSAHVECADCHNAHLVKADGAAPAAPTASNRISGTRGVTVDYTGKSAGQAPTYAATTNVVNEFELCLGCHSSYAFGGSITTTGATVATLNKDIGAQFNPLNKSLHPIYGGVDDGNTYTNVNTMEPSAWDSTAGRAKTLRCQSCHYPHGSNRQYLLKADPYEALCLQCHKGNVYSQTVGITNSGASRFNHNTQGRKHQLNTAPNATLCRTCHIGFPTSGGGIHGQHKTGGEAGKVSGSEIAESFITGTAITGWKSTGGRACSSASVNGCSKTHSWKTY